MGGIVERPYPECRTKEGKSMNKATLKRLSLALIAVVGSIAMAGCKPAVDPNADVTAPTVILVAPVAAVAGVALNSVVIATFSEAMDTATMIAENFSLMAGTTAIAGVVTYDEASKTATFTPTAQLLASTEFTATVTIGAADIAGNALAVAYAWNFTTGVSTDVAAPTIISTVPVDTTTGVAINAAITATFSEPMLVSSLVSAITLKQGASLIPSVVTSADNTVTLVPNADLVTATVYTATVSVGAKDLAGNPLAVEHSWSFTTGGLDVTAPTVLSTVPANSAQLVAVGDTVNVTFSEPMLPASIIAAGTFKLTGPGTTPVAGTVTNTSSSTARFTPTSSLTADTTYTATVTVEAKDAAGNIMAVEKVWSFFTGTRPNNPQAPVLGETARFVMLAFASITTTGTTTIHNGDMGLKTGTRASFTGFTAGVNAGQFTQLTNGLSYAYDDTDPALAVPTFATTIAFLDKVMLDRGVANDWLGQAVNPGAAEQVCPAELGTLTLTRGVYKTPDAVLISTGDVTLDAQGDPNSVWIFVIAKTLATIDTGTTAGDIILINGAQAKNVYWRTSETTNIAGGTIFQGNVFAHTTIAVESGAIITGRLFSMTTSVTLIADTVTKPE